MNNIIKKQIEFDFDLYDQTQKAVIGLENDEWATYHTTKHYILANDNEQIDTGSSNKEMKSIDKEIKSIRKWQIDEFKCQLEEDDRRAAKQVCRKCSHLRDCKDFIKPLSDKYFTAIKNVIQSDNESPLNAKFFHKNFRNCLVVIGGDALNVISIIHKNNDIRVKTAFKDRMEHLDKFQLSLLKASKDSRYHLRKSIKKWKRKFKRENNGVKEYQKVILHKEENWMWV